MVRLLNFFPMPMELTLVSRDDSLLATAAGQASFTAVLRAFKNVIDTAKEEGLDKILIDFLAVTGELPTTDLYEIGKVMAEYCVSKAIRPKVAVIGQPPLVTGFGAMVATNRGLTSMTFSERQPALQWLCAVGLKAADS